MTDQFEDITDEEVLQLIEKVAKPTFKFLMRRIQKEIFKSEYQNISLACFMTIMLESMATLEANNLRWLENFVNLKVEKKIEFDQLKNAFLKRLDDDVRSILN